MASCIKQEVNSMQTISIATLLIAANAAPLLASNLLRSTFSQPIDRGYRLNDGRPLFGKNKTWRGLLVALLLTSSLSWLYGWGWLPGVVVGAGAMAGDLGSSFTKRRLGLPSSARAPGLDQIPESLLPALLLHWLYGVGLLTALAAAAIFILVSVALSPLLFRWGL